MIGDPSFHRRRDAKRFVYAAKVVEREPQRDRCPVVLPLLAEAISQPGKSSRAHADAEVLAFHNRGADTFGVRLTHNWDYLHAGDFGGRIPAFAFTGSLVDLDEHREIAAVLKRVGNGRLVGSKAVRRNLEAIRRGRMAQPFDENV